MEELFNAIKFTNTKQLLKILEQKPSLKQKNKYGMPPLIYAMIYYNQKIIDLLLYYGADINIQDDLGNTILIYSPTDKILNLLVLGCNWNIKNKKNFTMLEQLIYDLKYMEVAYIIYHAMRTSVYFNTNSINLDKLVKYANKYLTSEEQLEYKQIKVLYERVLAKAHEEVQRLLKGK